MNKRISELSYKDWQEIIKNNSALYTALYDMAIETAEYWIGEYLEGFRGDYEISNWRYSFVKIGGDPEDYLAFVKWYEKVQAGFELFWNDREVIDKYLAEAEKAYTDGEAVDWYEVWDDLKEKLEEIIVQRLTAEYSLDDGVLLDYVESWTDYALYDPEECYVGEDYRIYREVPRRVIEAHVECVV